MKKDNNKKENEREKEFRDFCNKLDNKMLLGKLRFIDRDKKVEISVDESIDLENEIFLIEIDASNQPKLVAGQYTLINILKDKPLDKDKDRFKDKELIFIVIHCYKNYKPERSKKNFKLINENCFSGNAIKYGSIHINDLKKANTKKVFMNIIKKSIC